MKKTNLQICPICGKPEIDLYLGGYLGKLYVCRKCGYIGALVMEIEVENRKTSQ
ncbi:MAG: hypothetical protein N3H84_01015 [Candidatus Caldarchaeum sp.]|nr:hypothetical protein [Candidatus Caldarchaeum sp.]